MGGFSPFVGVMSPIAETFLGVTFAETPVDITFGETVTTVDIIV